MKMITMMSVLTVTLMLTVSPTPAHSLKVIVGGYDGYWCKDDDGGETKHSDCVIEVNMDSPDDVEVIYKDKKVVVEGMPGSTYLMMESLARTGATTASFFHVLPASNPRNTYTSGYYNDLVFKVLAGDSECKVRRILTDFDSGNEDHLSLRQEDDIVIATGQSDIAHSLIVQSVQGAPECTIKLPPDDIWRHDFLSRSIKGREFLLKEEGCKSLRVRRADLQLLLEQTPETAFRTEQCTETVVSGVQCVRRRFGICFRHGPVYRTIVNPGCVRSRDSHNQEMKERNDNLLKEQQAARDSISAIDEKLKDCV